jgi:hypothetical protein
MPPTQEDRFTTPLPGIITSMLDLWNPDHEDELGISSCHHELMHDSELRISSLRL